MATDKENMNHLQFKTDEVKEKVSKTNTIYFTDMGYKEGVPMIVESQKLALALKLANDGYNIEIVDTKEVLDEIVKLPLPNTVKLIQQ